MSSANTGQTRNKRKSAASPKATGGMETKKTKLTPENFRATRSQQTSCTKDSEQGIGLDSEIFPPTPIPTSTPSLPSSSVLTVPTPQEEVTFSSQEDVFGATMASNDNNSGYDSSGTSFARLRQERRPIRRLCPNPRRQTQIRGVQGRRREDPGKSGSKRR